MIGVVDLSGFVGGSREQRAAIGANWDARIECIVAGDAPARHPPITAGRHLMEKFRSSVG